MKKGLHNKIGLVLEYYGYEYNVEEVQKITQQIQDIYDHKEPNPKELRPLLKELYDRVVKNQFHADLLKEIIEELEKE
jgi:isopropylmalate/homocitrate/citramalate synthase